MTAGAAAGTLQAALLRRELHRARVCVGAGRAFGLAVVVVNPDLVVWCDGVTFWWRVGESTGGVVHETHAVADLDRAVDRVVKRHERTDTRSWAPRVGESSRESSRWLSHNRIIAGRPSADELA